MNQQPNTTDLKQRFEEIAEHTYPYLDQEGGRQAGIAGLSLYHHNKDVDMKRTAFVQGCISAYNLDRPQVVVTEGVKSETLDAELMSDATRYMMAVDLCDEEDGFYKGVKFGAHYSESLYKAERDELINHFENGIKQILELVDVFAESAPLDFMGTGTNASARMEEKEHFERLENIKKLAQHILSKYSK